MVKRILFLLTSMIVLVACQPTSITKTGQKNEKSSLEETSKKESTFTIKTEQAKFLKEFDVVGKDQLFSAVEEVKPYEGYTFSVDGLNDNGLIFGQLKNNLDEKDLLFAVYNSVDGTYKILKKFETSSPYAQIHAIGLNNEKVLYMERIMEGKDVSEKYFLYNIVNDTQELIYEVPKDRQSQVFSRGVIDGDYVYFDAADEETVNVYCFDAKKNKLEKIISDSYVPIIVEGKVYAIEVHLDENNRKVVSYDLENGKKQEVFSDKEINMNIDQLMSNGSANIYFTTDKGLYEYDTNKKEVLHLIKNGIMYDPMMRGNLLFWWDSDGMNLVDIKKQISYEFNQDYLQISNNGIVWLDKLENPSEIPKEDILKDRSYHFAKFLNTQGN